jgi:hypothetical protein
MNPGDLEIAGLTRAEHGRWRDFELKLVVSQSRLRKRERPLPPGSGERILSEQEIPGSGKQISDEQEIPESVKQILNEQEIPESVKQILNEQEIPESVKQILNEKEISGSEVKLGQSLDEKVE